MKFRCEFDVIMMYDNLTVTLMPAVMLAALKSTTMSKSKIPAAAPATKKVSKGTSIMAMLTAQAKARLANRQNLRSFFLIAGILFAVASAWFQELAPGLSLGLLYLMPDGEAKSGRTGSVVYMRNGRRRNYITPALVQNAFTTGVRASFSAISSGFKALTAAEIAAWNATTGFFKSNRFGQPKEVKGKALFVMLNQNLTTIAGTLITAPPSADSVPGVDEIVINIGVDPIATITYTGSTAADVDHAIFATASLSPGVSKPGSSQFRFIGKIAEATASPFDATTLYTAKFGNPVLAQKVFFKLVPINNISGQAGAAIVASGIVQP